LGFGREGLLPEAETLLGPGHRKENNRLSYSQMYGYQINSETNIYILQTI